MAEPENAGAEQQPESQEPTDPSNSDIKSSALFRKLAEENAALKRADSERLEAEDKATRDAEIKKQAEQGQFEEALKSKDNEVETLKKQHASDIQNRDIKTELLKTGFKNDMFINGAVTGYDPENGTISEYVAKLAADENNKSFLGETRVQHAAPGHSPVGGNTPLDATKLKTMQDSGDATERRKATKYLEDYFDTHGKLPPGF